jgi:cell division protein FtsB
MARSDAEIKDLRQRNETIVKEMEKLKDELKRN